MNQKSISIPYGTYRSKVFGCWLGKSIGGTLGGPWEGRTPPKELTFYDPVPTAMLENDDLDLQLVWLASIRDAGFPVTGTLLSRGWRDSIHAWPDEYGVCIRNLDQGLMPPLTGSYDNGFTAGMGAAIRTEIWACLAPGDPELARHLAREDARCDHADEGVHAAVFLATVESLAFVASDRDMLIDAGLAAIPSQCRVAQAIRTAREAWARTNNRKAAFEELNCKHKNVNFTDVPINLGIIVLGWCAGGGDFGKSILAAVNCGYDADCTCATLGALLGIISPESISDEWKKPIGETIAVGKYITGIRPPRDLTELTDVMIALAHDALSCYVSPSSITGAPKPVYATPPLRIPAQGIAALRKIDVPDNASVLSEYPLHITLLYPGDVRIAPGKAGNCSLVITNVTEKECSLDISLQAPLGWKLGGSIEKKCVVPSSASMKLDFTATPEECDWRPFSSSLSVRVSMNGVPLSFTAGLLMTIPLAVWTMNSMPETEPVPHAPNIVESATHFTDLAPLTEHGRTLVVRFEYKDFMARNAHRRFIVQSSSPTTVWINGEKKLSHDGTYHVPALHRAGKACVDAAAVKSPVCVTIAMSGSPETLFHAVGDPSGNCNQWISLIEYSMPR
ncbi:MAG: ADP-ribosylglycohydrolase family protein [Spirochaetes bacterium]|nr:ADP-ribosylglycohydrolase family protein [Spirochaetota bacterium]